MDKISIIIPAYIDTEEKKKWLNEAIDSALDQGESEIVVIDDCSPLTLDLDHVKYLRLEERTGPAVARNVGVVYAEGNLIFPLDADDLLINGMLKELYKVYQERGGFVYGNVVLTGMNKERVFNLPPFSCKQTLDLKGNIPVSALHSKEDHLKAGGWKKQFDIGLEDVEYYVSLLRSCVLGYNIGKPIIKYRKHETSRSKSMKDNKLLVQMREKIKVFHDDIYNGGNVMPCPGGCGGGSHTEPAQDVRLTQNLAQYSPDDKLTIEYVGSRNGSFHIVGPKTSIKYRIPGQRQPFEIAKADVERFQVLNHAGRYDFQLVKKPEPIKEAPPVTITPEVVNVVETKPLELKYTIDDLKLSSSLKNVLKEEGLSLNDIANKGVGDLQYLKGFGEKTEYNVLMQAKELVA